MSLKLCLIFICLVSFGQTIYSQNGWSNINAQNSPLVNNRLGSIIFDKNNNLWIAYAGAGGSGYGVSKFDGSQWSLYTAANSGLPNNDIRGIAVDNSGNLWFSCYNAGIVKFDGISWTVHNSSNSGIVGNRAGTIAIDKNNALWIAAYFDGISKFDGTNWTSYNSSNSPFYSPTNCINTVMVDHSNNIWVGLGCSEGLAMLNTQTNTWKKYTVANSGLAHHSVSALVEDSNGKIWIGYPSGNNVISRFDGTTWEHFTPFTGFFGGVGYDGLTKDKQGNIWLSGYDGLYKYNGTSWERIVCIGSAGETSGFSQSIAIDEAGNISWVEQNGGIWTNSPSVLPRPEEFTASTVNASSISLSWHNESANETGFQIERRTGVQNFSVISVTQPNINVFTDTNLEEGTSYEYRIKGLNQEIGSAYSPCVAAKTSLRPFGTDFELIIDEDQILPFTKEYFENHFSDPENDLLASVKILTLPELGFLTLNNQPVTLDQVIQSGSLSNLNFYPNENATGKTTFEVSMHDERDHTLIPTKITLNILSINDPPTLSNFDDIELKSSEILESIEFSISDVDNPLQTLSITAESNNQTVILNENLSITGFGSQRTLNIQHNGIPGAATIKVSVSDLLLTISKSFELSVSLVTNVAEGDQISIFPNPAKSEISLDLGNPNANSVLVVIIDSQGKEVKRITTNNHHSQINLSELSIGTYLVSIRNSKDQVIKTVRLNKQN